MLRLVRALELATRVEDAPLQQAIRANLAAWRAHPIRLRASLPHADWVTAVAFSPDGQQAATGGKDRTVRLWDVATGQPLGAPLPHDLPVWAVAFSPDDQALLTGGGADQPVYEEQELWTIALHAGGSKVRNPGSPAGQRPGEARLWDLTSGQLLRTLPHAGTVAAVQFSGDGRLLLTVGSGEAQLWQREGHDSAVRLPHPGAILAAALSPDGKIVVTGGLDGTARRWDTMGQALGAPLPHPGPVTLLTFQPAGSQLLTGAMRPDTARPSIVRGESRLWHVATGQPVGPPVPHRGPLKSAAFSADGRVVITGGFVSDAGPPLSWHGEARVGAPGAASGPVLDHPDVVTAVACSPEGRVVATGCRDGRVRFWAPVSGRLLAEPVNDLAYLHGTVSALTFSPDGRALLAGNLNEAARAKLFDVPPQGALDPPLKADAWVGAIAFSPDGRTLLTGSGDARARLWDADTGQLRGAALALGAEVVRVAFHPDGNTFVTRCADGSAIIWDGSTAGPPRARPLIPAGSGRGAAGPTVFAPDGRCLLTTGSTDSKIHLWEPTSGQLVRAWDHPLGVEDAAFSTDGRRVATGYRNGQVVLWDPTKGERVRAWSVSSPVSGVAFHPREPFLAVAEGPAQSARLWDCATGQPVSPALVHAGAVSGVAFSPDGQLVATTSTDRTARLWDVATGKPVGPPLVHDGPVFAAAFRPNGRMVATVGADQAARRWEIPTPVAGSAEQVKLWAELLTARTMDDREEVHLLAPATWRQRWLRLRGFQ